jgi:hypothetical protein
MELLCSSMLCFSESPRDAIDDFGKSRKAFLGSFEILLRDLRLSSCSTLPIGRRFGWNSFLLLHAS